MRKAKYPEMGRRIKEARIAMGLKQKDCLIPLGDVTAQMLSDWEHGYVCPSITYLGNISEFYNVSLDYIILGKKQEPTGKTISTYKDAIKCILALVQSGLFDIDSFDFGSNRNNTQTTLTSKDKIIGSFEKELNNIMTASKSMKQELLTQAIVDLIDKYDIKYTKSIK